MMLAHAHTAIQEKNTPLKFSPLVLTNGDPQNKVKYGICIPVPSFINTKSIFLKISFRFDFWLTEQSFHTNNTKCSFSRFEEVSEEGRLKHTSSLRTKNTVY